MPKTWKPPEPESETELASVPEADWDHPWRLLAQSIRLLWRWGAQDEIGRRTRRRFVGLYLLLVGVLFLFGSAFLLMALGLLRAAFVSAPLYPGLARRLGWQPPAHRWEAPSHPWRTLHTLLWLLLSGTAVGVGLWVLLTWGFCAQNWLCKLGLLAP